MVTYYKRKFKETERDNRESSVCWFILPKSIISNLSAGWVEVASGGKNVSKGHTDWRQVFLFMEGKGKVILNGKEEVAVESPMVLEIPYNCTHDVYASAGNSLKYIFVNDYSIGKKTA